MSERPIVTASVIPFERPKRPELKGYAWPVTGLSPSGWRIRDWKPDADDRVGLIEFRIPAEGEPDPTAALRAENERLRAALLSIGNSTEFIPEGQGVMYWRDVLQDCIKQARAALAQEPAR